MLKCESNHKIRNFGRMKLEPLKEYPVPAELESLEQNTSAQENDDWVSMLLKLSRNRTNEEKYFEAYTTMIHLEEAAQSKFLIQFKTTKIRLELSDKNEFCFANNVIIFSFHAMSHFSYS